MADQAIHEMIAAFVTGCMDKNNFEQFKDYLNEGGDLPKRELGELQNIISMVTVILDLENPNPSIKNMVAKKLIGMKEEIKTKILEDKKKTYAAKMKTSWINPSSTKTSKPYEQNSHTFGEKIPSTSTSAYQFAEEERSENHTPKGVKSKTPVPEEKTQMQEPKKIERLTPIEQPQSLFTQPKPGKSKQPQQEKLSSGIAGWIAILLVIVLFTILGYYVYSSVDSLHKQVGDLKSEVTSMRSQLGKANNYISNYTSLIEFFNYKDIVVYSLASFKANENASARVFLSFSEKEGLIQFKNAKPLQPNQAYQVWMVSRGRSYSLGVYRPAGSEYLKINTFPILSKENIESFRVTIESSNGSTSPSANTFLISSPAGTTTHGKVK